MAPLSSFAVVYLLATTTAGLVAFGLAVAAWRKRDQPAAPQFALLNLDVAGWCATAILIGLDVPGRTLIWQFNNVFVFSLIFVWFAFALAYTGRSSWLWHPVTLAVWSIPVVVAVMAFVPDLSALLITREPATTVGGLVVIPSEFTAAGSVLLVFVFALDLTAFVLLGNFYRRSRSPYRTQIGAIFGARLFGFVAALGFFGGLLNTELNLVPAAYAVQSLVIGWALFRYDLLDVAPLAADAIVEQMLDAVVVLDSDGRIVDHNPALGTLVDEAPSELAGRDAETVFPGLQAATESGETIKITPDAVASDEPRTRTYEPRSTPLYDHHDVFRGQVIVFRDVTLQRTRERTLEALQSATESFLDAADPEAVADIAVETAGSALSSPYSGVSLYDDDVGDIQPVALADQLGVALAEQGLLERVNSDRAVPTPIDRDGKLQQVYTTGEEVVGEEIVFRAPEGEVTVPATLLLPLGDHGVLGIGKRDPERSFSAEERRTARTLARATETALDRVAREQDLAESREALRERTRQLQFFNSALRHDLRNAITVVDANLELLGSHVSERGRSHLASVREWVADVEDLIDTVASITRTVTDDEDRDLSPVAVSEELRARIGKIADGHEQVTVETDIEPELTAMGDDLFGEVVENLLLNAVEHNDSDEPRIEVTAERRGNTVSVRIADNGPGIPAEFRGSAFEPGVTADDSDDSGSIGFGLYFVKVMVEEYGGSIHFEENNPRGTVAVLTLPIASLAAPR